MSSAECLWNNDDEQVVTCDAGQLSLISGIDVQTLRRYEQLGLLQRERPRYRREDLIQIERIVTMEVLGFSSVEIRGGLNVRGDLNEEFRIQMDLWKEKKRRLNHLMYFLEQAEQVNSADEAKDWHYVGRVVMALRGVQDPEYFRAMYLRRRGLGKAGSGAGADGGCVTGG